MHAAERRSVPWQLAIIQMRFATLSEGGQVQGMEFESPGKLDPRMFRQTQVRREKQTQDAGSVRGDKDAEVARLVDRLAPGLGGGVLYLF